MASDAAKAAFAAARDGKLADMTSAKEQLEKSGGALKDIKDESGKSPLHIAAQAGHTEVLKHLLESGFDDLNGHLDTEGNTALGLAVAANREAAANALLAAGANAKTEGPHGPVIVTACSAGYSKVAAALLDAGADPNVTSKDGMPIMFLTTATAAVKLRVPEQAAQAEGAVECLEHLLKAGSDPNVSAPGGFTPLHVAAEVGSDRMLRALLSAGADATAKTQQGQAPAAVAATWGHRSAAEMLLRHEASGGAEAGQSVDALFAQVVSQAAEQRASREAAAAEASNSIAASIPQPEDPDEAKSEALKAEGNKAFAAGDFGTALTKYQEALRHCTNSSALWANAAAAALRIGRHEEALKFARIARSVDSKNVKAWYREGQAAEGLKMWEDAAAAYFEAYLVQPEGIGGMDFGAMTKAAVEKGKEEFQKNKAASESS